MPKRPTIADIAEKAGVSISTVDRVLNSRHPVRGKTAEQVLSAAEALNYHGVNLLLQRVEEGRHAVSLGLLIQRRTTTFFKEVTEHINHYIRHSKPECRGIQIEEFDEMTPKAMAASIRNLSEKADVIGVMAFDHPLVNEAVTEIAAQGKPVVSFLSNLSASSLSGYVGIDHQKAGRTCGWALAKLLNHSGKIALLIESYQYRAFQEREIGIRSYMLEHEPGIELCEGVYGIASTSVVERMFEELLARHPDLKGVYFVGAGISAALKVLDGVPRERWPIIVCHELTPVTRGALAAGTVGVVLDSPRRELARELVDRMIESTSGRAAQRDNSTVEFRFYCPENVV
ncbi:LacI family transcriptional regulator [Neorhizobium galegae]|uniref:LacI family DNA-binding transcriptional regulator n=1 Tax=Neorhizobium galegae TaxID=399 RepID=UPI002784148F|nr:LacI family DNA-binding transcriptional regulator [Neorhizobium galegae]MDQ0138069.1 LacI family transcriptional regulator [Neorhizobium galegae]